MYTATFTFYKFHAIKIVDQSPEFPWKPTRWHLPQVMEMDRTPPEKGAYELARDRRVAEVQKRMAPVVAALQEW